MRIPFEMKKERENVKPTGLDNLSRDNGNVQSMLIKMLNGKVTTGQSSEKVNLGIVEQIVTLPLESRVRLLFDNDDNITRDSTRLLVGLASKLDLLTTLHTLVDVNFKHLSFLGGLLAATGLTSVLGVHHLTSTLTLGTGLLDLLHHRAKLTEHDLDTSTLTAGTGLNSTLLATSAITGLADNRLGKSELLDLAFVEVFERNGNSVNEVSATSGTAASSATCITRG